MTIWSIYIGQRHGETSGLESPRTRLPNSGWPPWVASQFRVAFPGLVQTLQAAQVAAEAVSVLKTSSNNGLPRPWITEPATDPTSSLDICKILLLLSEIVRAQ